MDALPVFFCMLMTFATKGEPQFAASGSLACLHPLRRMSKVPPVSFDRSAVPEKPPMPSTSHSTPAAPCKGEAGSAAPSISVVIPCYRETDHILDVIAGIGSEVNRIFVIDDACPDRTGAYVAERCADPRVQVVTQDCNTGVGGATKSGYGTADKAGCDIIVKLDGDGQMDPAMIPLLVEPLFAGRADYAKGNRFHRVDAITGMPMTRIAGNLALSLVSKLSSGYWDILDPTNGYTAIHTRVVRHIPMDRIANSYFFESDMLFRLGLMRAVVEDVPMQACYRKEESGIQLHKVVPEFSFRHIVNACRRFYFTYFVRDVSVATVQLIFGSLLLAFGVIFGFVEWIGSARAGVPATAGTVVLAALPIILGTQLLISFFNFDTHNVPRTPLHPRFMHDGN